MSADRLSVTIRYHPGQSQTFTCTHFEFEGFVLTPNGTTRAIGVKWNDADPRTLFVNTSAIEADLDRRHQMTADPWGPAPKVDPVLAAPVVTSYPPSYTNFGWHCPTCDARANGWRTHRSAQFGANAHAETHQETKP